MRSNGLVSSGNANKCRGDVAIVKKIPPNEQKERDVKVRRSLTEAS